MTAEHWRLVKEVVHAALARPASERAAFVSDACGDDAALRAEVESLLSGPDTGEGSDSFLASPAGGRIIAAAGASSAFGDHRAGWWPTEATVATGEAEAAHAAEVAARSAAISAVLAAALVGRYELEGTLGHGGMATVYLARDLRHRRRVALKVLHPELGALLGARRFLREIETAANLSHPHILPLFDSDEIRASGPVGGAGASADGAPPTDAVLLYYVMPYVAGESLRARLRREGRLADRMALRIVSEVAAALDYAHRHGVVHRDIKPENILLDEDGHALVADFGIARADAHDAPDAGESVPGAGTELLTERGRIIGTPAYMSPEQARGQHDFDGRSDQYSLACVAFELLAGAAPFAGTSAEQLVQRPTQVPVSLLERRPDLPPAVDVVLARALALARDARFETTSAFAEALAASVPESAGKPALSHDAPSAVHPVTVDRRSARRPLLMLGTGIVAASALVATLVARGPLASHSTIAASGPPVLAVLPFENLGPPSDAYFAEGLTDELTGRLAAVSGLRVIAASSARQYKGSTKTPREIARELGATHLLTGTVRWERAAGDRAAVGTGRVRVRPELVRAADHATMWTEPVEGSLEDVFLVQANVAKRVAASLHVALLPRERDAATSPPTRNAAAYEAYLRALASRESESHSPATAQQAAIAELERAISLDPRFVAAYARLAQVYAGLYWVAGDPSLLARMRTNVERAWALDSTLVDSRLVRVGYLIMSGDLERAHRAASALVAAAPGLAMAHDQLGAVEDVRMDMDAAIASYQRAATLDPRSPGPVERVSSLNQRAYRYAESVRYRERYLALQPEDAVSWWVYMMCHLAWRADTAAAARVAERGGPTLEALLVRLPNDGGMAALWHQTLGPRVWRVKDTLTIAGYSAGGAGLPPELFLLMKLRHFALTGQAERERAFADSAVAQLEPALRRAPDVTLFNTSSRRAILAEAYARLGRAADAGREIDRYVADVRRAGPPRKVPIALVNAAYVDVLIGRRDQAVARLSEALRLPAGMFISRELLRTEASWEPLRGNPEFERLVAGLPSRS